MMKKLTAVLSVFLLLSSFVFAHNYSAYPVEDTTGTLYQDELDSLNQKIKSIQQKHNNDLGLYIAVTDSYSSYAYSIEEFAEQWYRENNLGLGSEKNGLLLIMTMDEREYDIAAYGSFAHSTYTDFGKSKLGKTIVSYFKNDSWYKGFDAYLNQAEKYLTLSENGKPFDVDSVYFDSKIFAIALISSLIGSFFIALITTLILKGKMNNVKAASNAGFYIASDSVKIVDRDARFTHITEHRTPINQGNPGGGGGPSGGTTINSGGFSHSSGHF